MLPTLRQRLFIAITFAVGAVCFLLIEGPLSAANASSGIALFDARVGFVPAVALVLLASVPVMLLSTATGALGSALSGVFAYSAALTLLATIGGSSRGFLWRADLPRGFFYLALTMLLWLGLYVLLGYLLVTLRGPIRRRLGDVASPAFEVALPVARTNLVPSLLGGVLVALGGGVLTHLMLKSVAPGQIVGSLVLGFAVAAVIGKTVVPQMSAGPALAAPMLVGVAGYLWAWLNPEFGDAEAVMRAWYRGELTGVALALPIHYASAGVTGCTIGLGIAQGLVGSEQRAAEERLVLQFAGGPTEDGAADERG